ncbi:MAG: hypothetical protein COW65_00440 [Cytophagales bacterium CG18_big_fil_WC_8_21_14_2_50_42_9]|nr:MAG: hypothetical protein COW65_00440 [Cytophagales bacterium CG18_big_fil_WC_8_21_14_2_50_42_9]
MPDYLKYSNYTALGAEYRKENYKSQAANLDIRNKSLLILDDLVIPALTYTFSDSAQLDLKGNALQILKK